MTFLNSREYPAEGFASETIIKLYFLFLKLGLILVNIFWKFLFLISIKFLLLFMNWPIVVSQYNSAGIICLELTELIEQENKNKLKKIANLSNNNLKSLFIEQRDKVLIFWAIWVISILNMG